MRTLTNDTDFYVSSDLMVYSNGYEDCEAGHSYGPCRRRSWLLHYITAGKGIFRCADRTWHLQQGDLFLCVPGQEIYYEADPEEPWGYGWIGLQGSRAAEYFSRTSLLSEPVVRFDASDALALLFVRVQQAYFLPESIRDLRLNALAYELMEFLILHFPVRCADRSSQETLLAQNMITWLTNHLHEPVRMEDLCAAVGLSRSHASRVFSRVCRISIQDFLWQARETEACRLLRDTALPIGEIAQKVGYEDPVYFSRIFRQKTGLQPTQYRSGMRLNTRTGQTRTASGEKQTDQNRKSGPVS